MARQMVEDELETTWFERHGSTPITEIPDDWPQDHRKLVERRIELIETDSNIGLIERPSTNAAGTPSRGTSSSNGPWDLAARSPGRHPVLAGPCSNTRAHILYVPNGAARVFDFLARWLNSTAVTRALSAGAGRGACGRRVCPVSPSAAL